MGAQNTEVSEEQMLKALSELEEDILKAEAQSDDTSESASSESESASDDKKAKKSHVREDRAPLKALPKSTKEANQHLAPEAGEGEEADVSAKSFRDSATENTAVRKGLDASPFLEGLVDSLNDEIDGVRKALVFVQEENQVAIENQAEFNRKLSKAIVAMGSLIQEQHEMIKSLGGRPATTRKSLTNPAEVQERFQKSGDGVAAGGEYQFDRATVLRKAVEMAEAGKIPSGVVIQYETSESMEPQFQKAIYNELVKEAR